MRRKPMFRSNTDKAETCAKPYTAAAEIPVAAREFRRRVRKTDQRGSRNAAGRVFDVQTIARSSKPVIS